MTEGPRYEHYRDSIAEKNSAAKDRNRFFALSLAGACVLCMYAYDPVLLSAAAQSWFAQYGIEASVSGAVLQSALWVFVLYVFVRYLQAVVAVERSFLYVRKLESKLAIATREGEDYDSLWVGLPKAIDFLYKGVFIAAFNIALIAKVISEMARLSWYLLFDVACCVAILVLSLLYWRFLKIVDKRYVSEGDASTEGSGADEA